VGEDVARIGPGGDLFELAIVLDQTLEHGAVSSIAGYAALMFQPT
jgi:hypothetical protein